MNVSVISPKNSISKTARWSQLPRRKRNFLPFDSPQIRPRRLIGRLCFWRSRNPRKRLMTSRPTWEKTRLSGEINLWSRVPTWSMLSRNLVPKWTTSLRNLVPKWTTSLQNLVPNWTTNLRNLVPIGRQTYEIACRNGGQAYRIPCQSGQRAYQGSLWIGGATASVSSGCCCSSPRNCFRETHDNPSKVVYYGGFVSSLHVLCFVLFRFVSCSVCCTGRLLIHFLSINFFQTGLQKSKSSISSPDTVPPLSPQQQTRHLRNSKHRAPPQLIRYSLVTENSSLMKRRFLLMATRRISFLPHLRTILVS